MKEILLLFICIIIPVVSINSQQHADLHIFNGEGELRTIYVQRHRLNENYTLNLDGGSYIGIGTNFWTRWGFRGNIQRTLNHNTKVDIGFMYNRVHLFDKTNSDNPEESFDVVRHEYRPHQSLNVNYPRFASSALQHRFRLEERIFKTAHNDKTDFRMRLRYRLMHQGRFDGKPIAPKSLFYRTFAEFNFNIYEEADDVFWVRGRYCLGIGYQFNSRLSADTNYFFEHNKTSSSEPTTNIHIFQITLRHTIYWQ
ncbi:DUF2490 domain-containing protein [Carboxylicivirga mesophila]|uniref:DUF2490 domain-containing protein n=1 Tax=Carboxylicivirga mesophila TaxID=1166478 RepID=A0ABS5KEK0_9BACT|nr:DUF2490 domain-containing protein [Carboxylicivirga mesophila]MBS2212941.1 DUF2490 domain-containing protein [Carboxylicivirga mesophila]